MILLYAMELSAEGGQLVPHSFVHQSMGPWWLDSFERYFLIFVDNSCEGGEVERGLELGEVESMEGDIIFIALLSPSIRHGQYDTVGTKSVHFSKSQKK